MATLEGEVKTLLSQRAEMQKLFRWSHIKSTFAVLLLAECGTSNYLTYANLAIRCAKWAQTSD